MTPAQRLQEMIDEKYRAIDRLQAEVDVMLTMQVQLGFVGKGGGGGGGRKRDPDRHEKMMQVLTNAAILGATVSELSNASGYGIGSMQTKIKKMFKAGEVERVSPGRYRLKGL